jgi:hypothetical protein
MEVCLIADGYLPLEITDRPALPFTGNIQAGSTSRTGGRSYPKVGNAIRSPSIIMKTREVQRLKNH